MSKRKTIDINSVRVLANEILAAKHLNDEQKTGVTVLIETILHRTGNYRGYNYPDGGTYNEKGYFTPNGGENNRYYRG